MTALKHATKNALYSDVWIIRWHGWISTPAMALVIKTVDIKQEGVCCH